MGTAKSVIGHKTREHKQSWMTDEILSFMDERRKFKNLANKDSYQKVQKLIKAKIRIAMNEWLKHECETIEKLQTRHDDFNLHKKMKEMAGIHRKRDFSSITNENNEIACDTNARKIICENYIRNLFSDERILNQDTEDDLTGPPITRAEIERAIQTLKNNKAPGPDEIPAELIKLLDDKGVAVLRKLFNRIYETGQYPLQWLSSTFIPLPKKNNAKKCEDHRLISLMSHSLKLFLKIIHQRIFRKCEQNISDSQFGFRQGLGTREALVATQVLVQNCHDQRKDVCLCFIDFEKAFDRVQHQKLLAILRQTNIDGKDIRCIESLYLNQSAQIKIDGEQSNNVEICRGVRQGVFLSPLLFNLYSESIFREALENIEKGIRVNLIWINNIRYADDTVLIADNMNDLQYLINVVGEHSKRMGLKINTKKTKHMVVTRQPDMLET